MMPCSYSSIATPIPCAVPPQVSPEVLSQMKQAMVASSSGAAASHSFLLDDDSSLPFQAQDLLATVDDKVRCLCRPRAPRRPRGPRTCACACAPTITWTGTWTGAAACVLVAPCSCLHAQDCAARPATSIYLIPPHGLCPCPMPLSLPCACAPAPACARAQELYVGVAVPEVLREAADPQGGFFTFLEKEMRFSAQ